MALPALRTCTFRRRGVWTTLDGQSEYQAELDFTTEMGGRVHGQIRWMLVRTARNDPYSQAVTGLARSLHQEYMSASGQPPAKDPRWVALMSQVTGFWKSSHEG